MSPSPTSRWSPSLPLVLGIVAVVGGISFVACARPGTPPGGPPDRLPALVVGSEPDTFATVEPGLRRVRFRFSERISERPISGSLNDAVRVSPATGEVRVEHERRSLVVTLEGGFRGGLVYRVTILPVIQDLFGNVLGDPFELVFSTGGEFHPSLLAGRAVDRITGEVLEGVKVLAFPQGDSLTHVGVADSAGIFALRYLPPEQYRISAFQDLNRNDSVNFAEPQASRRVRLGASDTILLSRVALLAQDTTPAVLASVEPADSVSLELSFDDYLDPDLPLEGIRVELQEAPDSLRPDSLPRDSLRVPDVEGVYHPWVLDSLRQARADSAARAEGEEVPDREEDDEEERLPRRVARVLFDGTLTPGGMYQVEVSEVTNIFGTGGGGGSAVFQVPEPPPPDTAAQDSAAQDSADQNSNRPAQDSTEVLPDTLAPDSSVVDTLQASQDSTAAADTTGLPPDTSSWRPSGVHRYRVPPHPWRRIEGESGG